MGHRCLVAVERDIGRFDCYRSQWGGLAVRDDDAAAVVANIVEDQQPLATGVSAREVLALLDFRSDEALLVRTPEDATAYLVRRLCIPVAQDDRTETGGPCTGGVPVVLVPVTDSRAVEHLDTVLRTAKGILGDAVDAGLVPRVVAERSLRVLLARHPDVPAGALWLTGAEVRATM